MRKIFGDVVNTASRIETTGEPNRIHLSEQTAELIKTSGREHWVELRKDRVTAKGVLTVDVTSHRQPTL